jgi:hypothetical protein
MSSSNAGDVWLSAWLAGFSFLDASRLTLQKSMAIVRGVAIASVLVGMLTKRMMLIYLNPTSYASQRLFSLLRSALDTLTGGRTDESL